MYSRISNLGGELKSTEVQHKGGIRKRIPPKLNNFNKRLNDRDLLYPKSVGDRTLGESLLDIQQLES